MSRRRFEIFIRIFRFIGRDRVNIFIGILILNMLVAVIVFKFGMTTEGKNDLSFVDSLYFVVTIVTTIGFGDFSFKDQAAWMKVFGIYMMISGASGYALVFGLMAENLLRKQLLTLSGRRTYKMKNHVILCGYSRLGPKILDSLLSLGDSVVVVTDKAEVDDNVLEQLQEREIPYVKGDMTKPEILQKAGLLECKSIILGSSDDLRNLEAALTARELRDNVKVILRIYDANLARKIQKAFGISSVLSTSTIAAPSFAYAAHSDNVLQTTTVNDTILLTITVVVRPGSQLDGMSLKELTRQVDLCILCFQRGHYSLHFPKIEESIRGGDQITLTTKQNGLRRLSHLNSL